MRVMRRILVFSGFFHKAYRAPLRPWACTDAGRVGALAVGRPRERLGSALAVEPGIVPGLAADDVQGVGGPAHHVERVMPTSA